MSALWIHAKAGATKGAKRMHKLQQLLDNIPDYESFMTVAEMDASSKELTKNYPEQVELLELGDSKDGHPIYALKIGEGTKNALMYGCPHPNEPMGAMLLEYLSKAMVEDPSFLNEYDYTWYLIKSIDVDGTKKNEEWFKPPFSVTHYARNFFRPASHQQVEWTFPVKYKDYTFDRPIPETVALMDLIDAIQPEFIYSLHNAGFGGTYWYISQDFPRLWEKLYEASAKQEIPLSLGEPEVNYIPELAPAIFKMFGAKEIYDYYEEYGTLPAEEMIQAGTSAHGYCEDQGYNSTVLVTELPYFYEPAIENNDYLTITREESFLEGLNFSLKESEVLESYFKQLPDTKDNQFLMMVEASLENKQQDYETSKEFVQNNEAYKELCKVSEDFDNSKVKRFYNLLSWSLLLRGIEAEIEKGAALEELKNEVEARFNERAQACEELLAYKIIPIKKLIRVQLESGLLVLDQLKGGG